MQRNYIIIAALVLFAGGLAFAVWWMGKGTPPVDNTPPGPVDVPFPTDKFFLTFDLNKDGTIPLEEFVMAHEMGAASKFPFEFNKGPGQPPLKPEDAFAHLDLNRNGKLDRTDLETSYDKAWLAFKQSSADKGFEARIWRDKWMTFNPEQSRVINAETGARNRGELPFGGQFFPKKYFDQKRYVAVVNDQGETTQGFLWEDRTNNRLHVLRGDAVIDVFDPAKVSITEMPSAPQLEYIQAVQDTPYDNPQRNLELARRCKELGLLTEAGMMYSRVLVFEPENKEALDALGFENKDGKFVRKGG
jgi:hypothetical protein